MSEDTTIRSGIQYVQGVFKQISLLLQTADQQLGELDFHKAYGNICIEDTGVKVGEPEKWLPNALFRFYGSDESPRVLLFVSVLLDDRYAEYKPMSECLLTAGAFVHKGDGWSDKDWKCWWARWHGFHDPRYDDGRVTCSESKDWPEQDEDAKVIERLFTVGRPLPDLRSAEDLKIFLAPLLDRIAAYRSAA
ncbi:hypothetical protein [Sorangium sp. So ce542]|uniref:hypothetical protein n=1 Tax=Sorangium sp. So ce542 TaxID=3133316 RepID=UPI003F605E75